MESMSIVFGLGFLLGWILAKKDDKQITGRSADAAPPEERSESYDFSKADPQKQQIDSVSMLLYFGAFLMVAGVGLFVGLSDFSGGVKTTAVMILALGFYAAGLLLHGVKKLQPVGVTLTAIGLVCLPLTGAAAYFYTEGMLSGSAVWFVTSAVSFILYVGALWRIRQSFMGYMAVCMGVSLWLSAVAIIEAPVYFFGWAGIILALVYLVAARHFKFLHEVEQPLSVSANVLVPASIGIMLVFGMGEISLTHMGVSLLLAAVFYMVAAWYESSEQNAESYFGLGYLAIPAGALLITAHELHSATVTAWVVTIVAALQLVVAHTLRKKHSQWHSTALNATTILLVVGSVCSLPLFGGTWAAYAWLLVFDALMYVGAALFYKNKSHAAFGAFSTVLLVLVVGFLVMNPHAPVVGVGAILIGLALLFVIIGRKAKKFTDVLHVASIAALVVAWVVGLAGSGIEPALLSCTVSLALLLIAYSERLPQLVYVGLILGYIAIMQAMHYWFIAPDWYAVGLLGLGYYLISKILEYVLPQNSRADIWMSCGLLGLFFAPAMHFLVHAETALFSIWAPCMVAVAGGLTGFEAYRRRIRTGIYIGAGACMVAAQWLLYIGGQRELQVYTHLWALYFAGLAWHAWRERRNDERDTFTATALTVMTIPLGIQALNGETALGHLLLAEGIVLLLAGLYLRYRLVAWWGLAVAVCSVLYQLRELQFVVLVLLGLAIIGLGAYLLLRQDKK